MLNTERNKIKLIFLMAFILLMLLNGCTTMTTSLETDHRIHRDHLKKGKACVVNLFGGFTIPYFKDTSIRLSGSDSIRDAIVNGKIDLPVIIDKTKKHYIVYSRKCTIVYGQ